MTIRFRAASTLGIALAALLVAGCGDTQSVKMAREAEAKGDPATAYDYYLRAASQSRVPFGVSDGLTRTRPAAASYWERQALAATDEGRYGDAWKMWMKVLEIQPDDDAAPSMVRELETRHGTEVSIARNEWRQGGSRALASAHTKALPPESVPPAIAATEAGRAKTERPQLAMATPQSPAGSTSGTPSSTSRDEGVVVAPHATPSTDPNSVATGEGSSSLPASPAPFGFPDPSARTQPRRTAIPPVQMPPPPPDARLARLPVVGGAALPPADGRFTLVRTYSKTDRRFPRRGDAIDGIELNMRDTDESDDTYEVDLDLYFRGKRVKKVRELPVGRSQTFRGASGQVYRLTILNVNHDKHSVRIGFRPI